MSFSNFYLIYALEIFFATFCSEWFTVRICFYYLFGETERKKHALLSNARLLLKYFLRTGSYVTVQREFREAFPDRESPS